MFYVDFVREHFGRMQQAFAALDEAGQAGLAASIAEVGTRFNRSGDATPVIHVEYLEGVAIRR